MSNFGDEDEFEVVGSRTLRQDLASEEDQEEEKQMQEEEKLEERMTGRQMELELADEAVEYEKRRLMEIEFRDKELENFAVDNLGSLTEKLAESHKRVQKMQALIPPTLQKNGMPTQFTNGFQAINKVKRVVRTWQETEAQYTKTMSAVKAMVDADERSGLLQPEQKREMEGFIEYMKQQSIVNNLRSIAGEYGRRLGDLKEAVPKSANFSGEVPYSKMEKAQFQEQLNKRTPEFEAPGSVLEIDKRIKLLLQPAKIDNNIDEKVQRFEMVQQKFVDAMIANRAKMLSKSHFAVFQRQHDQQMIRMQPVADEIAAVVEVAQVDPDTEFISKLLLAPDRGAKNVLSKLYESGKLVVHAKKNTTGEIKLKEQLTDSVYTGMKLISEYIKDPAAMLAGYERRKKVDAMLKEDKFVKKIKDATTESKQMALAAKIVNRDDFLTYVHEHISKQPINSLTPMKELVVEWLQAKLIQPVGDLAVTRKFTAAQLTYQRAKDAFMRQEQNDEVKIIGKKRLIRGDRQEVQLGFVQAEAEAEEDKMQDAVFKGQLVVNKHKTVPHVPIVPSEKESTEIKDVGRVSQILATALGKKGKFQIFSVLPEEMEKKRLEALEGIITTSNSTIFEELKAQGLKPPTLEQEEKLLKEGEKLLNDPTISKEQKLLMVSRLGTHDLVIESDKIVDIAETIDKYLKEQFDDDFASDAASASRIEKQRGTPEAEELAKIRSEITKKQLYESMGLFADRLVDVLEQKRTLTRGVIDSALVNIRGQAGTYYSSGKVRNQIANWVEDLERYIPIEDPVSIKSANTSSKVGVKIDPRDENPFTEMNKSKLFNEPVQYGKKAAAVEEEKKEDEGAGQAEEGKQDAKKQTKPGTVQINLAGRKGQKIETYLEGIADDIADFETFWEEVQPGKILAKYKRIFVGTDDEREERFWDVENFLRWTIKVQDKYSAMARHLMDTANNVVDNGVIKTGELSDVKIMHGILLETTSRLRQVESFGKLLQPDADFAAGNNQAQVLEENGPALAKVLEFLDNSSNQAKFRTAVGQLEERLDQEATPEEIVDLEHQLEEQVRSLEAASQAQQQQARDLVKMLNLQSSSIKEHQLIGRGENRNLGALQQPSERRIGDNLSAALEAELIGFGDEMAQIQAGTYGQEKGAIFKRLGKEKIDQARERRWNMFKSKGQTFEGELGEYVDPYYRPPKTLIESIIPNEQDLNVVKKVAKKRKKKPAQLAATIQQMDVALDKQVEILPQNMFAQQMQHEDLSGGMVPEYQQPVQLDNGVIEELQAAITAQNLISTVKIQYKKRTPPPPVVIIKEQAPAMMEIDEGLLQLEDIMPMEEVSGFTQDEYERKQAVRKHQDEIKAIYEEQQLAQLDQPEETKVLSPEVITYFSQPLAEQQIKLQPANVDAIKFKAFVQGGGQINNPDIKLLSESLQDQIARMQMQQSYVEQSVKEKEIADQYMKTLDQKEIELQGITASWRESELQMAALKQRQVRELMIEEQKLIFKQQMEQQKTDYHASTSAIVAQRYKGKQAQERAVKQIDKEVQEEVKQEGENAMQEDSKEEKKEGQADKLVKETRLQPYSMTGVDKTGRGGFDEAKLFVMGADETQEQYEARIEKITDAALKSQAQYLNLVKKKAAAKVQSTLEMETMEEKIKKEYNIPVAETEEQKTAREAKEDAAEQAKLTKEWKKWQDKYTDKYQQLVLAKKAQYGVEKQLKEREDQDEYDRTRIVKDKQAEDEKARQDAKFKADKGRADDKAKDDKSRREEKNKDKLEEKKQLDTNLQLLKQGKLTQAEFDAKEKKINDAVEKKADLKMQKLVAEVGNITNPYQAANLKAIVKRYRDQEQQVLDMVIAGEQSQQIKQTEIKYREEEFTQKMRQNEIEYLAQQKGRYAHELAKYRIMMDKKDSQVQSIKASNAALVYSGQINSQNQINNAFSLSNQKAGYYNQQKLKDKEEETKRLNDKKVSDDAKDVILKQQLLDDLAAKKVIHLQKVADLKVVNDKLVSELKAEHKADRVIERDIRKQDVKEDKDLKEARRLAEAQLHHEREVARKREKQLDIDKDRKFYLEEKKKYDADLTAQIKTINDATKLEELKIASTEKAAVIARNDKQKSDLKAENKESRDKLEKLIEDKKIAEETLHYNRKVLEKEERRLRLVEDRKFQHDVIEAYDLKIAGLKIEDAKLRDEEKTKEVKERRLELAANVADLKKIKAEAATALQTQHQANRMEERKFQHEVVDEYNKARDLLARSYAKDDDKLTLQRQKDIAVHVDNLKKTLLADRFKEEQNAIMAKEMRLKQEEDDKVWAMYQNAKIVQMGEVEISNRAKVRDYFAQLGHTKDYVHVRHQRVIEDFTDHQKIAMAKDKADSQSLLGIARQIAGSGGKLQSDEMMKFKMGKLDTFEKKTEDEVVQDEKQAMLLLDGLRVDLRNAVWGSIGRDAHIEITQRGKEPRPEQLVAVTEAVVGFLEIPMATQLTCMDQSKRIPKQVLTALSQAGLVIDQFLKNYSGNAREQYYMTNVGTEINKQLAKAAAHNRDVSAYQDTYIQQERGKLYTQLEVQKQQESESKMQDKINTAIQRKLDSLGVGGGSQGMGGSEKSSKAWKQRYLQQRTDETFGQQYHDRENRRSNYSEDLREQQYTAQRYQNQVGHGKSYTGTYGSAASVGQGLLKLADEDKKITDEEMDLLRKLTVDKKTGHAMKVGEDGDVIPLTEDESASVAKVIIEICLYIYATHVKAVSEHQLEKYRAKIKENMKDPEDESDELLPLLKVANTIANKMISGNINKYTVKKYINALAGEHLRGGESSSDESEDVPAVDEEGDVKMKEKR